MELSSRRGVGGYQYSRDFLSKLWSDHEVHSGTTYINLFQLFDPQLFSRTDVRKIFYIDQTLEQLFSHYPDMRHASKTHQQAAIAQERQQYQRADLVIAKSAWAKESLCRVYGLPQDAVHVMQPGGNISLHDYELWRSEQSWIDHTDSSIPPTLRMVFVGKDPVRKGLDRLIKAMTLIPRDAGNLSLSVIGSSRSRLPRSLRSDTRIAWLGEMDKTKDIRRFMDCVAAHDIGVLLSRAEAGGISLREYQMLGVPVLGPDVGGSPEFILPGCGQVVAPDAKPRDIAKTLELLLRNFELIRLLKQRTRASATKASWRYSGKLLSEIITRALNSS